jgi:hypothetical protein
MSTNEQQHNLVENCQLSGYVRPRDEEAENSSPETRRPRLLHGSGEAADYDHPQVLCFAARNRRGRFYIPCKDNIFGGITVENVLLDSGCSTLLLPFPLDRGFPAQFLESAVYQWIVSSSRGTGSVHSPVLKVKKHFGNFPCTLAGKEQPPFTMLRFHLGSQAANQLLNTPELRQMLDGRCVEKLNDFLGQLRNRVALERTYALLGQSYLSHVMYCQMDDVAIALSTNFQGTENIVHIMGRYKQKLLPLVDAFEGFHDLEDDDGDEDEEEYRLSWDISNSDDDVDEPDGR